MNDKRNEKHQRKTKTKNVSQKRQPKTSAKNISKNSSSDSWLGHGQNHEN